MIVVTGATGRIGTRLLPRLLAGGEPVRVVVRDPDRLPAEVRERVEVVTGSHGDPKVADRAFEGADSVFWLALASPTASGPYEALVSFSIPGAEAIVRHGVERVVTVSALGREAQRYAGLVSASLAMDDLLRSTGARLRALALPGFMDNLLWQLEPLRRQGVFTGAMPGDLRLPAVAVGDIADTAARLLLDHTWTGQGTVGLMGPEDISADEMAAVLTEVLGRPIRYERISREAERQGYQAHGFSPAMAQSMVDMGLAKEQGIDSIPPRTPATSSPTTFRQWAEEVLKPAVEAA
ncbi:NAD(P)H-binding protein [Phaeacidiphilus oryzae]|jgi:uncharacterized protein YbjT (DUF2867 family)|uniref:NAD(P)H-binding protein n=1 Tax=Phaeacidiphilus oryzae TaxID=348818 RepID=UPI000562AA24|nr:NAD(P)H-binding protein [Phaeacidiphilus oryzae]